MKTDYPAGMDKKFSVIMVFTTGAFLLTVFLFVVVTIELNVRRSTSATSAAIISVTPEQREIDHPGQKIFKANCSPCHRIHQKLIGSPLAGVHKT